MSEPRRISEKYKERPEVVAVSYGTDAGEAVVMNEPRHLSPQQIRELAIETAKNTPYSVDAVEQYIRQIQGVNMITGKIDLNDLRHQLAPPTYNRRQRRAAMRGKKRY